MTPDTEEPPPPLQVHWELPLGWMQTRSVAQASVTALGPVALARPPRITATLESVSGGLLTWWDGLEKVLPQALDDFQLLDSGAAVVAGLAGVRRLVHYTGRQNTPTVLEQWAAQQRWPTQEEGELRVVVMATMEPRNYDGTIDALAAMVAQAHILPREEGGRP